jgi:hypothetical protein
MKHIVSLAMVTLLLCACAGSPYAVSHLDAGQIKTVSDDQLCRAYNHHIGSGTPFRTAEVMSEIKRRKIECDPIILDCENQGFKKGTHDMLECVAAEREVERPQYVAPGAMAPSYTCMQNGPFTNCNPN